MYKIYSKQKNKKLLHIFYRFEIKKDRINLTPENEYLQASVIRFKNKKVVNSHHHLKHKILNRKRSIQESWILIKGLAKIYYYDTSNKFIKSFIMKPGDVSITLYGGHKLEILKKNTTLYEYKTGPYEGNSKDLKYFT